MCHKGGDPDPCVALEGFALDVAARAFGSDHALSEGSALGQTTRERRTGPPPGLQRHLTRPGSLVVPSEVRAR